MKEIFVKLYPAGETVRVKSGTELRRLAEAVHADFHVPCGGKGRCGKCKVVFEEGAPNPTPTELDVLTEAEIEQGYRLGCMAVIYHDAVVYLPSSGHAERILTSGVTREIPLNPYFTKRHFRVTEPIVSDLRSDLKRVYDSFDMNLKHTDLDLSVLRRLGSDLRESNFDLTAVCAAGKPIFFEHGDTTSECYGVAIDVGTTTLAAYLLDLNTGKQLAVASAVNPQTLVGDDVISRISYSMQSSEGLGALRTSVVNECNRLVKSLADSAGVCLDNIYDFVVVGNTCMTHMFLGIDPQSLAQSPYVPVATQSISAKASDVCIDINPCGKVYVMPSIAGYVGSDTVGVILSTRLHEDDQLTLAVDIGTNGEIVLGSKKRIVACSTAAGPAFEGAHIKHGMRASDGAIDSAWLDEEGIRFSTVGHVKPTGICGSGLLDVIMCLLKAGIVDSSGRIVDTDEISESFAYLRDRLRAGERGNEYVLADETETFAGTPIVIVQRDIRELQLAKAAIAAGIQTLMDRLHVSVEDLDRVVLAGAFGNYIRKESAIGSGMLPAVSVSKLHSVGNAAGEGAKLSLLSVDARRDADNIADTVEYVELTTDSGFEERFVDALTFGSTSWM